MKRFKIQPLGLVIGLVSAVLIARLLWTTAAAETGWETLGKHLQYAPFGWLTGFDIEISRRDTETQCEYWKARTKSLVEQHPKSAAHAIGAAMVLDDPTHRHVASDEYVDTWLVDRYCVEECLKYSWLACEHDPDNVIAWRTRALTLFGSGGRNFIPPRPRASNWYQILDEAAQRDSDNALYDYLTASVHYQASMDIELNSMPHVIDPEGYELALSHVDRGLEKPLLLGTSGNAAALATFVSQLPAPRNTRIELASCRFLRFRTIRIVTTLWNLQIIEAQNQLALSQPREALRYYRKAEKLADQLIDSKDSGYLIDGLALKIDALQHLINFGSAHLEIVPSEEISRLQMSQRASLLQLKIRKLAMARSGSNDLTPQTALINSGLLVTLVLSPATCLALLAGFLRLIGLLFAAKPVLPGGRLAVWRCAVVWAGVLSISVVVFGLVPTDIVGYELRGRGFQTICIVATLAVLVLTTAAVLRPSDATTNKNQGGGNRQMSLRGMFVLVAVYAGVAALWHYFDLADLVFRSFAPNVSLPLRSWNGYGVEDELRRSGWPIIEHPTWRFVVIQWGAYGGLLLVSLVASCLIVAWQVWRLSRQAPEGFIRFWILRTKPERYIYLLTTQARSLGWAAVTALLIYLAASPNAIQEVEDNYQFKRSWYLQPQRTQAAIDREMGQIRADDVLLKRLRAEVRAELP